jgi:hypothetical protein
VIFEGHYLASPGRRLRGFGAAGAALKLRRAQASRQFTRGSPAQARPG